MTNRSRRLPAEWSEHSAVLLSWPHADTDWADMLGEVTLCYRELVKAITPIARLIIVAPDIQYVKESLAELYDTERILLIEMPTNDTWVRDFGMICVKAEDGSWHGCDYKFNGWGLKFAACYDNLINRGVFASGHINEGVCRYENHLNFVLEGGGIDVDEDGVMLTTSYCLLSPNRNGAFDREEISRILTQDFGLEKIIWLEHGALEGDDTDSHVDTLARFIPGHVIAYTSCDREGDSHYEELRQMEEELKRVRDAEGRPYGLLSLPIPEPIYDEDGQRLPATYANFLIINNTVFMPVYGDSHYDEIAVEKIRVALPLYDIVTVNCRALIRQHGSLHCATMQVPDSIIN